MEGGGVGPGQWARWRGRGVRGKVDEGGKERK